MKILFISNCPLIESQGSGYVIVNTGQCLQNLGHQVDLIPPEDLIIWPSLSGTANLYRMALGMGIWCFRKRNLLKKYELIFFYGGESYLAIFIIKKILKLKVPIVLHSNGLELHVKYKLNEYKSYLNKETKKWYHFNIDFLFRYCYKKVNAIITVSEYELNFAVEVLKIKNNKIFYVEPALPKIFFDFDNTIVRKNIITFCGSWIDRKGIDALRIGLPIILRDYPEFIFRIIGVGNAFELKENFPLDVIGNIEVVAFVEDKNDLIKYYLESLIFVHPSVCESFGLTVAEAMFCGCAVITGPTGIAYSLANNEEAIVLQEPNVDNIVKSIELLINNKDLVSTLSLNGKKRVESLRWELYQMKLSEIIIKIRNIKI